MFGNTIQNYASGLEISEGFNVRVNTNNGVERQNKLFKYSYLKSHKNNSLTVMLTVLIEDFLPDNYSRYVEKNVRFSSLYQKYNQNIPQFLVNRLRHLVVHCMERWEVAKNIPKSHITIIDDVTGEFKVKSQLEQTARYNLQFGDPSSMPKCECPDWLQTFLPCKHFLAIFHHLPTWQWDSLPTSYRESPLLLLDNDVM
ncbi:unnamed protein product, partial [Porites evermanni]